MNTMGALGLGIVLTLKDKASAGLDTIRQKMAGFSSTSQEMIKNFDAGARQLLGGIASIVAGVKAFSIFDKVFENSVRVAGSFEQKMARVKAVSDASEEVFEAMKKQAEDLGRTTIFTQDQVAEAQENLVRASFKTLGTTEATNEVMAAMPGLLNTAQVEAMDLARTTSIVAGVLRSFNLEANQSTRVADVLTQTSRLSKASIETLGEALKYVGPYAEAVGVDLEQTNAMLGVMHNNSIESTRAGTSLKAAFIRLAEEPKRVAKALQEVGVQAKTSTGELRPLPELLKDLYERTKNMGKADRLGIFNRIFGSIAGGGMLAVMSGVVDGSLAELENALRKCSGASEEMAEIMNDTYEGAIKRLESATDGLSKAIGDHLKPAYRWIIEKTAELKNNLTDLIKAHPILSKFVIGLAGSFTILVGSVLIAVGTLATVGGAMKLWKNVKPLIIIAMEAIKTQAKGAMLSLKGMSVPILGLIALAGALYYAYQKNLFGIRDMFEAISEGFTFALNADDKGIIAVEQETVERLKKAGNLENALNMGAVFYRFREFWHGIEEGALTVINNIKEALKGIGEWFNEHITKWLGENNFFSDFLKMFKPDSFAKDWKNWGKIVGALVTSFLGLALAIKAVAISMTLLTAASNPVFLLLAALIAIMTHYKKIQEFFLKDQSEALSIMPKDMNQGYDVFKQQAINKGYQFDEYDKVKKLPDDVYLYGGYSQWQDAKAEIESKLAILKMQSNPKKQELNQNLNKEGIKTLPNLEATVELTPTWEKSATEEMLKRFNISLDQPETILQQHEVYTPPDTNMFLKALQDTSNMAKGIVKTPSLDTSNIVVSMTNSNTGEEFTKKINDVVNTLSGVLSTIVPEKEEKTKVIYPPKSGNPATPYIIKSSQNQAAMNANANIQAAQQVPERPVKVDNKVDVHISSTPINFNLDGEKIGSVLMKHNERHTLREGGNGRL